MCMYSLSLAPALSTEWRRLIGSLIFIGHFSAKVTYIQWLFGGKIICNLGDPMRLGHPVSRALSISQTQVVTGHAS